VSFTERRLSPGSPRTSLESLIQKAAGPRLRGWVMMISSPGAILAGLFYEATRVGGAIHRLYVERDRPEYARWIKWSSHHLSLKEAAEWVEARGDTASELYGAWAAALEEKEAELTVPPRIASATSGLGTIRMFRFPDRALSRAL
jgi:hypothetical protein